MHLTRKECLTSRHDYTFSSLINRMLEIQSEISKLYNSESLAEDTSRSFLQEHRDLSARLEKARTESVTEFTLEPIPSSSIDAIIDKIERVIRDDSLNISQKLIQSEKLNAELLKEASALVAAISAEASQLLRSASRTAEKRRKSLTG